MCGAERASNWDRNNNIFAGHVDNCLHCLVHGELPSMLVVHTQEWDAYHDNTIFYYEDDEFVTASVDKKDDTSIFKLKEGNENSVHSQLMLSCSTTCVQ